MSEMFSGCKELKSINLSKFNTYNITRMNKMFYKCSALTSLDITNFNTRIVTTMENMFAECSSLTSLNLSNFETGEVNNMAEMFRKCSALADLNLNKFDSTKVTKDENMFNECNSLTKIKIGPKFVFTENSIYGMNKNCKIVFNGNERNAGEIMDYYYNDDKKSINSNCTYNALFGSQNSITSSVRSNDTMNLLIESGIIKK